MDGYRRAAELLRAADTVVVSSHIDPDGDGIGSGLALLHALEALGKQVRFIVPTRPAAVYDFLPGFERIRTIDDEEAARCESPCAVLVACDCAGRDRLGAVIGVPHCDLINLDHHPSNPGFGVVDLIDATVACTAQVVGALLAHMGVALDARLATCCYAALVFDTGRFMHANTAAAELRWAATLLETGIDAAAINRALTYTRSEHDLHLLRLGIDHLCIDEADPRLAGMALSATAIAAVGAPDDWGDLVEIPRSLRGNQIAYLLREAPDQASVRASLRANPPFVVEPVAAHFGGGGHRQAAGCTIPGDLAAARAAILPLLRECLRDGGS